MTRIAGVSRRSAATGIVGLAMALLSFLIPMRFPEVPEQVLNLGIGVGLLLLTAGGVLYPIDRDESEDDPDDGVPVRVDTGSVAIGRDNSGSVTVNNSRNAGRDYYENATFQEAPRKPPVFSVTPDGASQRQEAYVQEWNVAFVDGERPEAFEWRFRTPYQPPPAWRAVEIEHMPRAHFRPAPQDVSGALLEDPDLGLDQVAFELRYFWQDRWHHERHTYEVIRRQTKNTSPIRTHVELGRKLPPVAKWTEA